MINMFVKFATLLKYLFIENVKETNFFPLTDLKINIKARN